MKILLNLLPPEKKEEMRKNSRFRMVVLQGAAFLSLGAFYYAMLLGISFLLSIERSSGERLSGENVSRKQEVESYESVFRDANKHIAEISAALSGHVSWSHFFRELERSTPPGILYTSLMTKTDLSLEISGKATDRESLLLFERQINESDCFRDAIIPLADKLVKENIDFQLSAAIERTCVLLKGS
ncbi:MAG: PilN domain-containing protein [Candidatus Moraniibacteriota bacterium]|nr:MAG: PilN domain-containing protein [Candidatus Moranbacteria bacterium]